MKESLSDAQEAQAQKLAQAIAQASYEDILAIARTLVATDNASLFGDTEFTVRALSQRIAATAYRQHLQQKNGYQGAGLTCPHCHYAAAYHGDRRQRLVGLCGDIPCQRAYYYCRRCGQGFCPFDQQAGIGPHRLTPAAEQLATLAGGVSDSFDKARQLLHQMAGVRLSESTIMKPAVPIELLYHSERRIAARPAIVTAEPSE